MSILDGGLFHRGMDTQGETSPVWSVCYCDAGGSKCRQHDRGIWRQRQAIPRLLRGSGSWRGVEAVEKPPRATFTMAVTVSPQRPPVSVATRGVAAWAPTTLAPQCVLLSIAENAVILYAERSAGT